MEGGAYSSVSIGNFGMAMLMGMGYDPATAEKSKGKKDEPAKRRPVRLGLGATTLDGKAGVEAEKTRAAAQAKAKAKARAAALLPKAPARVEGSALRKGLVVRVTREGKFENRKLVTVAFESPYWLCSEGGGEEGGVEVKEKYLETVVKVGEFAVVLRGKGGWEEGMVGKVKGKTKSSCEVEGWEGEGDLDDVCMLFAKAR